MKKALCLLLPALIVTACKSTPNNTESTSAAAAKATADLSWADAKDRKSRLENVHYKSSIQLNGTDEHLKGRNVISFDLKDAKRPLRLDFYEGTVSALKVNGTDVPLTAKKQFWIELPAEALKEGPNTVDVTYTAAFTRQGIGMHRFVDPETKEVFFYTKLEPYEANRVWPSFDQPDLRSTMDLEVQVPGNWKVISTTRERVIRNQADGTKLWQFPATPALSTYLFSLHAGPYKVWEDRFENIPLRIFARPSMAKYVRSKEWFTWTKQGLKFFNTYFAFKYPFKKYDQIFVPEASGAMENVASVTFTEAYLSRSEPTREHRLNSASVLMHEMAHMWFGDIVTMSWWNDLWLNESFATFMAAHALNEATEFKDAWQDFFASDKGWAYWEDGLVTTHPIEAPVNTVKEGFAIFDGITYGKGASVVKQLRYYVGPKNFDEGIRHYIKTNAYKNTQLTDFIGALQGQTKKDLNAWADLWLRQSGTDKVQAQWTCEGKRLKSFNIATTSSPGARFRPQTFDVALFGADPAKPVVVQVNTTGPLVTQTGDWDCPRMIYPNYGDHGYMQVSLDPVSLKYATQSLSQLRSPLLRNMLWHDLWDMVRAGEMPLKDYIAVIDTHFAKENDVMVLNKVVETISSFENRSILQYWSQKSEESKAKRNEFIARMESEYLKRMRTAAPGSDAQKFWFDEYVRLARSENGLKQITKWIDGSEKIDGLPLDLDRKWALVRQLSRFQPVAAAPFIEMMKKQDASDRGRRNLMVAEAIQPLLPVKQKWIDTLRKSKQELSLAEARSVMAFLFPPEQSELSRGFDDAIFTYLKDNAKSENDVFLRHVAARLSPLDCDPARASRFKNFISKQQFSMAVTKPLRTNLQEDERCQLVRAKSQLD